VIERPDSRSGSAGHRDQQVPSSVHGRGGSGVDLTGQLSHPRPALQRLVDQDLRALLQAGGPPSGAGTKGHDRRGRGSSRQRRLKAHEIDKMVAAYEDGMTLREIGTAFGVHRTTVSGHLKQRGVSLRGQGLDDDAVPEVVRLYKEGRSAADLGETFGVSHQTILSALRREAVEVRPAGFGART
jgi:DNA-binding CsgD family transcriptional regulator